MFCFLLLCLPLGSTRTDPLVPSTTLFRSDGASRGLAAACDADRLGVGVVGPALGARLQGLAGLPGQCDEPAGAADRGAAGAGAGGAALDLAGAGEHHEALFDLAVLGQGQDRKSTRLNSSH